MIIFKIKKLFYKMINTKFKDVLLNLILNFSD